jgi:hypothetical protein
MSTHANRVQQTVSGTPGTGTITLSTASSGYQTMGTAYGADATVDILITEGTSWEVARNCTYTHSGTTVTRGTLESSSTGSAISFTSAAVVSVIATADAGRRWDAAALEHVAGTDADTTMAVNTLYVVDMSAWATADRNYTLPATAAVGDRCGVMVSAGDASHELILKANTGDTLNGVTAAEWSRLFITGEVVIMRCVTANAAWIVEYDGRVPSKCRIYRGADTTTTATVDTLLPLDTNDSNYDVGSLSNVGSSAIVVRRAGMYDVQMILAFGSIADGKYFLSQVNVNGSAKRVLNLENMGISSGQYLPGRTILKLAANDSVTARYTTSDSASKTITGGDDLGTCDLVVVEILP